MKHIEIFKPGKHTAVSGAVIEFTEAEMKAAAAAYDPAKHEAPLVVGHPTLDGPAYGWVQGLSYSETDSRLLADPNQVEVAFAEMVNAGRFKKVSASWYTPTAPNNPVPGVYYLRHVGFLGATPPSVKGLKSASFAEAEEGVVEFADWAAVDNADMWRRLREWVIGKFGIEEADKVAPSWVVDSIKTAAVLEPAPASQTNSLIYSEGKTMTPAELAARAAELDTREKAIKANETAARNKELVEFADSLVAAGQLLPANKDKVVGLLQTMPEATVISFGEGDAKVDTPAIQVLKDFLKSQPKIVNFSEVARADKDGSTDLTDNKTVSDRATAYKQRMDAQGTSCSFAEAVDAVHAGKDQPAQSK